MCVRDRGNDFPSHAATMVCALKTSQVCGKGVGSGMLVQHWKVGTTPPLPGATTSQPSTLLLWRCLGQCRTKHIPPLRCVPYQRTIEIIKCWGAGKRKQQQARFPRKLSTQGKAAHNQRRDFSGEHIVARLDRNPSDSPHSQCIRHAARSGFQPNQSLLRRPPRRQSHFTYTLSHVAHTFAYTFRCQSHAHSGPILPSPCLMKANRVPLPATCKASVASPPHFVSDVCVRKPCSKGPESNLQCWGSARALGASGQEVGRKRVASPD